MTTASPSGSTIPLIDASGTTWTINSAGQVVKNGVADTTTNQVTQLLYFNSVVYQFSTVATYGGWYGWINSKWTLQTGDPRVPVVVTPPVVTPSASGTLAPPAASLTDSTLAVWTLSGGVVSKNGTPDKSTSQVTQILYFQGVVYQFSTVPTFGGWYGWIGSKWVLQASDPRTPPVVAPPAPTSSSMLGYIQSLVGKKILIGQHVNFWDSNPMDCVTPIPSMAGGKQVAILGTSNDWDNFSVNFVTNTNAWIAQGGIVLVSQEAPSPLSSGEAVSDIWTTGTNAYKNWTTYLNTQIAKFKQLNGTVIWRPFIEVNGNHFGSTFTPAQNVTLFQHTHDYCVAQGLTNVLWMLNLNFWDQRNSGSTRYDGSDYYPGNNYVDLVSIDSYPPDANSDAIYNYFVTTGKPIIFAEVGGNTNNSAEAPGTYNNDIILSNVKSMFPKAVAIVYWCQNEGLNEQLGTSTVLNDPVAVTLSDLPKGLK